MVIGKLRELERLRGRVAALEAGIAESMQNELAGLPAKFGFADVKAFAAAVERGRCWRQAASERSRDGTRHGAAEARQDHGRRAGRCEAARA